MPSITHPTTCDNSLPEPQRELILNSVKLALFLPLSLAIILVGVKLVGEKQQVWRKASDAVTRVLADTKRLFPEPLGDREVYFVDVPAQLLSADRPGIYRAFGVGFVYALALIYGQDFATDIHLRFTAYRPHLELPFSYPISYGKLQELASDPQKVVMLYDERLGSVGRLLPEPPAER